MIPSNPSTDNGSQVNQMTCQFTTGFSEKQQLCFQRPKLQEYLWGRFSSSAPWKIGNAWKTFFSFAFGGQRSLFMGICIYIYICLKLRIRSRYPLSTVGSPWDVAIHALASKSPQPEVQQQSWQSTTIVRLGFLVPKNIHLHKNGELEVGSWNVERFGFFFCFPVVFFCFTTSFFGELDCWRFEVLFLPFSWWWSKQTSKFPNHSNVEKTRLGT